MASYDPKQIQQVYEKFFTKSEDELENIISRVDQFETEHLDNESRYRELSDEYQELNKKLEELKSKQQQKHSEKRQSKIEDLEQTKHEIETEAQTLHQLLSSVQKQREEFLLVRHVIQDYIMQGIQPAHTVISSNPNDTYKAEIINPIHEVKTEHRKDFLKLYLEDIYEMYKNHSTDDEIYAELQSYPTEGLDTIYKTNKKMLNQYNALLDSKVRMDMRVGKKPKGYNVVLNNIRKYEKDYNFVKRTQPIIEKILKERQQTEIGTDPITEIEKGTMDIDKLKNLVKLHPNLKDIIGTTALSEMVKTGNINKTALDNMKEFFKKENVPTNFNPIIRVKTNPVAEVVRRKPTKLEDYADLIPPRISIIRA